MKFEKGDAVVVVKPGQFAGFELKMGDRHIVRSCEPLSLEAHTQDGVTLEGRGAALYLASRFERASPMEDNRDYLEAITQILP